VLDACVLVPVSLCDMLLWAADRQLYRPLWSEAILDEMERNVARVLQRNGRSAVDAAAAATYRRAAMATSYPDASIAGYESLIPAMTNHPKDRHVLAAAIRGQAHVIVTANLTDFPDASLAPFSIVAQTPDDFLNDLLEFGPPLMLETIIDMAASKGRPPMTPRQIMARLKTSTPRFAEAVLMMLDDEDS
jgi:hypothetical protein